MRPTAILALEDGSLFRGVAVGAAGAATGEVIFNTAMTGYQEILTDPAYRRQMIALTYPHIGNAGTNAADAQSDRIQAAGLIVREVPRAPSNWRSEASLLEYLQANDTVAIADIDSRRLTRLLREKGTLRGCIMVGDDAAAALAEARACEPLEGQDLATNAGTRAIHAWQEPSADLPATGQPPAAARLHVAVYDYGVSRNTLRQLVACGARVSLVPAQAVLGEVLALPVDGVVLSGGPGDPAACSAGIATARALLEHNVPTLGLGLGHQLLGLAAGAVSRKLRHGHYGANHSVRDVDTGEVLLTSQNHGFELDPGQLPPGVRVLYRSLNDDSVQGIEIEGKPAFSFQGQAQTSRGTHDPALLLRRFIQTMEAAGQAACGVSADS
ncbi:MAG TPA: glutamine-hydrolyzing carbamoyl-phosphate synthase small subunit [Salinisphaeraceae bacterium]|nr:glutamine-hydrolyzing carbamoyl-phosphate synthase small subunit [Salinisphaeraceae bacterium]